MAAVDIILALNEVGGKNGIGITDLVENRLVGMKSRGVYETPGGTILYKAHQVLETLCLDRDTQHYEGAARGSTLRSLYTYGQWYTPLRAALSAFVDQHPADGDRACETQIIQGEYHNRRRVERTTLCTARILQLLARTRSTIRRTARASSTSLAFPSKSRPCSTRKNNLPQAERAAF